MLVILSNNFNLIYKFVEIIFILLITWKNFDLLNYSVLLNQEVKWGQFFQILGNEIQLRN